MGNQTLPIITTTIDPLIRDKVATSGASLHKLATPQTTEVITYAACSSLWIIWTPRYISWPGSDGTAPGDCDISVRSPWTNSPVLIGGNGVPSTRGHSGSLQKFNKRKSTVSEKIRDTQTFDASIDGKLANDGDYTSIFSKVIGRELSHSYSTDLYLRCRTDFASNAVGTKVPNFVDLGLPSVNASDEFNTFGTTNTRIRRQTD